MTIVLIDDHPILSMGLVQGLLGRGVDALAMKPAEPAELIERLSQEVTQPQLVVMDLAMPSVPCTPTLVQAVSDANIPVIMLSGSEDENALASCLLAGAIAIMSKDESVGTILDTIEDAAAGKTIRPTNRAIRLQEFDERAYRARQSQAVFERLSAAEALVLTHLMDGRSAADIAADRFVSMPTVRTQIKAVLSKLGVTSQLEAVALANRHGFHRDDSVVESN